MNIQLLYLLKKCKATFIYTHTIKLRYLKKDKPNSLQIK